ncbi:MFS transporter [Porticoccaceae bacterium]|nr:MFS transporter [Porticoccaceae bacterium]
MVVLLTNRPFLLLIGAVFLISTGVMMISALLFFMVDAYLGMGEYYAIMMTAGLLVGVPSLGLWYKLMAKKSKIFCLVFGLSGMIFAPLAWLLLITILLNGLTAGVVALLPSFTSDVIDYDAWKSGQDRAATYFSLYTLTLKSTVALGGALALGIAGAYGFDATLSEHSEDSIRGLHLAIGYLPALCFLLAIPLILLGPITQRRHKIIRARLDQRMLSVG